MHRLVHKHPYGGEQDQQQHQKVDVVFGGAQPMRRKQRRVVPPTHGAVKQDRIKDAEWHILQSKQRQHDGTGAVSDGSKLELCTSVSARAMYVYA